MATLIDAMAVGGPRDGVKLSASRTWDGRIEIPAKYEQSAHGHKPKFIRSNWHPGKYVLKLRFDKDTGVTYFEWVWIDDTKKTPNVD